MQHFECDYLEGAHPKILERLVETNMEKTPGYGEDIYCESAREKIRAACGCPNAPVHFLVGGTQTNATVIDTLLHGYEGVIAASTGHVASHEAGAIEFGGHKVLTIPEENGMVSAENVQKYLDGFYGDANHDHMVFPGMLYISHPTEYGTLYSLAQLQELHGVCQKYKIPLYIDGARLGYALSADDTDVTLTDIAHNCDVFYIGGTKVGAMFGEAVVFPNEQLAKHFFTITKQHGGLLAKGRLLGIQFDTLFTDNLYCEIAAHAIDMAKLLVSILKEKNYRFYLETPTNQQFVIVDNEKLRQLDGQVSYSSWEAYDDTHTVIRFATSWATRQEDVEALRDIL